jgi:3-hydroxy-9,10-secoandrosta-1,3,5(10)-triene-9,17-dione monooxygenase
VSTAESLTYPLPPEPGLMPGVMIERAREMREQLVADQAETEVRTYFSPEMHERFDAAGFYRLYVPRRYGGYEFDVPTYVRVVSEIARGCVSTGWCLGLSMNHALQVASWWPASAQDAIFGDGTFRAGSVAAPVGKATPTEDGWKIDGQVAFASGSPYATHYVGQVFADGEEADGPPKLLAFVAPRSEWEMLHDWGDILGLKGSGSHSLRFDGTRIPADWAIEADMVDVDVSHGTPGLDLHGNPMYAGRAMGVFTMSLASVMVGGVFNALDEYEQLMRTKKTPTPPFVLRVVDAQHQEWFGKAYTRARTAQAALFDCAEQHMALCRRAVEEGVPFTYGDDMALGGIAREVMLQCWDIMQSDVWQTVGASVARDGQRMARVFRDLSVGVAHRNPQQRGYFFGEIAREVLGEPRTGKKI